MQVAAVDLEWPENIANCSLNAMRPDHAISPLTLRDGQGVPCTSGHPEPIMLIPDPRKEKRRLSARRCPASAMPDSGIFE